jgi:RNA polymerase sigma-70 factor, ECF subfamily
LRPVTTVPEIIVPEIVVLGDGDTADPATQVVRLFDEFRESLFRYLRWLGCLPEEADDAIQETFLRLYAHLAARGSQENLRAWLFRVAGNVVRDERKSGRRRLQEPLENGAAPFASWVDPAVGPEQQILAKESAQRLNAAIRRLPADQQRCVALRSEGFRYREIAAILGIGVTTVADTLRRAVTTPAKDLP